jgi:hypothetical protein
MMVEVCKAHVGWTHQTFDNSTAAAAAATANNSSYSNNKYSNSYSSSSSSSSNGNNSSNSGVCDMACQQGYEIRTPATAVWCYLTLTQPSKRGKIDTSYWYDALSVTITRTAATSATAVSVSTAAIINTNSSSSSSPYAKSTTASSATITAAGVSSSGTGEQLLQSARIGAAREHVLIELMLEANSVYSVVPLTLGNAGTQQQQQQQQQRSQPFVFGVYASVALPVTALPWSVLCSAAHTGLHQALAGYWLDTSTVHSSSSSTKNSTTAAAAAAAVAAAVLDGDADFDEDAPDEQGAQCTTVYATTVPAVALAVTETPGGAHLFVLIDSRPAHSPPLQCTVQFSKLQRCAVTGLRRVTVTRGGCQTLCCAAVAVAADAHTQGQCQFVFEHAVTQCRDSSNSSTSSSSSSGSGMYAPHALVPGAEALVALYCSSGSCSSSSSSADSSSSGRYRGYGPRKAHGGAVASIASVPR